MPKYFCDYCDTFLTHDSPSVRKTHCSGRKHKENVKFYYQKWMEDQAQSLIDATTAAFKAGRLPGGATIPPPAERYSEMLTLFDLIIKNQNLEIFNTMNDFDYFREWEVHQE